MKAILVFETVVLTGTNQFPTNKEKSKISKNPDLLNNTET